MTVPVPVSASPVTVAVMISVPAQPMSRYDAVATPFTVATLGVRAALPLVAHGEVKLTLNGVGVATPLVFTVTLTAVVPKAESNGVAMVTCESVMFIAPVEKPTVLLTADAVVPEPIWPLAVTIPAPDAVRLAEFRMMLATPLVSVNAEPDVGENVPNVGSVVKVTTTPGAGAPVTCRKVAATRAGFPAEMEVLAAPVPGSNKPTVMAGEGVAVKATEPVMAVVEVLPATTVCVLPVTVAAPAEVEGYSSTEATPDASVTAAAFVGTKVPSVLSVRKVTTAPAIGVLVPVLNVALTFAGLPGATVVTAALVDGSVRVSVNVGVPVLGPVPPEPVLPDTPPPPQADSSADNSGMSKTIKPRCRHVSPWMLSFAVPV